jgi:hypothetical protein
MLSTRRSMTGQFSHPAPAFPWASHVRITNSNHSRVTCGAFLAGTVPITE